jgi:hypothetical protein
VATTKEDVIRFLQALPLRAATAAEKTVYRLARTRIEDDEWSEYVDLDEDQLAIGAMVEMEHTSYEEDALRIASVHLEEDEAYYAKLAVLEESSED